MTRNRDRSQAREREHFDQLVEESGETYWGNRRPAAVLRMRRRAEMAADALRPFTDPLVMEIGCGAGTFSEYLLARLPELRLVGTDISPRAIERAADRCGAYAQARFQVADAAAFDAPAAHFDAVVGCSILHHLPYEQTLQECHRVLKPGGAIWFCEPNMMNPQAAVEKNIHFIGKMLDNSEDETAFFRWSLAGLLRRIGFDHVRVVPHDFLHPIVPASLMGVLDSVGRLVERVPLLREIGGCLAISARKPGGGAERLRAPRATESA